MRLELYIDVLDKKNQHVLVEDDLTPVDLIAAILEEFQELDYLSNTPDGYQLRRAVDGAALEPTSTLRRQVDDADRLILAEVGPPLPGSAQRPTQQIYLREQGAGRVYKLHWYPAIIGRPDPTLIHNDWLAINLADHEQGLRVSRRHAQIVEEAGAFYIECLSSNPITVQHAAGPHPLLQGQQHPLAHGDTIYLDKSQIVLKFIVRQEEGTG